MLILMFFRKSDFFFRSKIVKQKSILFSDNIRALKGAVSQCFNFERVRILLSSGLFISYFKGKFKGKIIGKLYVFISSIISYSFPFPFTIKSISNSSEIL